MNPLNGGLTGFIQRSQEAGGVGNLFKNSLLTKEEWVKELQLRKII